MTTPTDTNGGTKSSESKSEVTGVIKTPLPPDDNFPKLVEGPPRVDLEPRLSSRLPADEDTRFNERKPLPPWLKIAGAVLVSLVVLGMFLYSCKGVSDLKSDTASLEADVTKLQTDSTATKTDVVALKKGVDDLNQKVDPMIKNVKTLTGTVEALDAKVRGLEASKANMSDLSNKADKSDVAGAHWRITRVEKKIEEKRVVAAKDPTPMPTEDKTAAPVAPQPTHNQIYRPVPVYIDTYKPRSKR